MYAEKEGPKGETDFAALDIIFAEGLFFCRKVCYNNGDLTEERGQP